MAGNKSLHNASIAKQDEFYTQLSDIANELKYYKNHFRDKVVLCNCDDPYESNFFKYFALHFNDYGLKKLICTCWNGSPITGSELNLFDEAPSENGRSRVAYKVELSEVKDLTGDGVATLEDVQLFLQEHKPTRLQGNGDFRSQECIDLLKEADIVVTNPPFSLFREYVAQLMEYEKKFLIIGNFNAVTYKEVFPLIKDNKLWLGVTRQGSGSMWFMVPNDAPTKVGQKEIEGIRYQTIGTSAWFTNLDHKKRHYLLDLYKHYTPEEYPLYDNYSAIEVSKVDNIPEDYDGVMGVPITFLGKYCPEQFEIVWQASGNTYANAPKEILDEVNFNPNIKYGGGLGTAILKGKPTYSRILIRKKQ